jgi:AraC-like DNA-binding protein
MQGARRRFPVDEPHIVPFSVPDRSGVIDIVIDPDESPFSFQFREQIVELIGDVVSRRCDNSPFGFSFCRVHTGELPIPPGVKPADIIRNRFMNFIVDAVIKAADRLVRFTAIPLTEIAEMCGYQSIHSFSQSFKKVERVKPVFLSAQGGKSVRLRFYSCKM